ncbi:MAG: SAM-dependent methyltransferase [Halieaceae bacterium]|nr:SAM-dependent methyltransferase [Halieaceae bacterium]MCP4465133.1 SAM-dependent methyltransferase [Halieaceae bacterium]MCP4840829.1 SAM-dependent methyltransferase [Halieaceae bacterium]MDG2412728.1 SAM-dependent methyltransferase [Halioglobus sp.]
MLDISSPVNSNQTHLHPRLATVVQRHLHTLHRAPISDYSRRAYAHAVEALVSNPRPLVIDSFCGTGHSTALLAQRHPDHYVIGIDKSAHRLGKHRGNACPDYCLLQANCEDIWALLAQDKLQAAYHYILYPNPWPKARHLQRRIHGHASLPCLLALGGQIELRSNWQLYVEEFGSALHLAGHHGSVARVSVSDTPLSLFERKYRQSGHDLWSFRGRISQ